MNKMLTLNQSKFSSILDTVLDREIRQQQNVQYRYHNDDDDDDNSLLLLSSKQTTAFDPDSTHSMIPIKSIFEIIFSSNAFGFLKIIFFILLLL